MPARQREERGEDQLMRQDQRKCQRSRDWKQGDALSPMHISRAAVVDASDASPRDVLASTTNSSSGSGGIIAVKQGRVNTILNRAIAIEFTILSNVFGLRSTVVVHGCIVFKKLIE